jgi:hypothetical protein
MVMDSRLQPFDYKPSILYLSVKILEPNISFCSWLSLTAQSFYNKNADAAANSGILKDMGKCIGLHAVAKGFH